MDSLLRVWLCQFRPQFRSLSHNARQKISRCVPARIASQIGIRPPANTDNARLSIWVNAGSMHLATTPLWSSPEGHTSAIVARKNKAACRWEVPAGCTSHKAAIMIRRRGTAGLSRPDVPRVRDRRCKDAGRARAPLRMRSRSRSGRCCSEECTSGPSVSGPERAVGRQASGLPPSLTQKLSPSGDGSSQMHLLQS